MAQSQSFPGVVWFEKKLVTLGFWPDLYEKLIIWVLENELHSVWTIVV
jgi:hypothetical protein